MLCALLAQLTVTGVGCATCVVIGRYHMQTAKKLGVDSAFLRRQAQFWYGGAVGLAFVGFVLTGITALRSV